MSKIALAVDYVDKTTHHKFHLPLTVFQKPRDEKEYKKLEKLLDKLIDEVRDNEKHPLAIVMQIIGDNLEDYDTKYHSPMGFNISAIDMVKYLMKVNKLYQNDLAPIFGGQANVSKFLRGERQLNTKQIQGLNQKFGISADFFIKERAQNNLDIWRSYCM